MKTDMNDIEPQKHTVAEKMYHPQADDAYTQEILEHIIERVRNNGPLDANTLDHTIRAYNRTLPKSVHARAKKMLLPYYAYVRGTNQELWNSWNIDRDLEHQLILTLRMKPSRTSNGVATVTVLTKPWMCGGGCLFCPRDVRMPKSYLHDEPACQRAELNMFDPYLQVTSRLSVLESMGHRTNKVELIVLGGTWDDYPAAYRAWFCKEMFRALNDVAEDRAAHREARIEAYHQAGITEDRTEIARRCAFEQARVDNATVDFNQAVEALYKTGGWAEVSAWQTCSPEELFSEQDSNETSKHQCVGLSVETRPERVSDENLAFMRSLGVTRVQLGVQSLDPHVLSVNSRHASVDAISEAFSLVRSYGLKLHAHFMANLYQSTPEIDKAGYKRLVEDPQFKPDEIKLYPCALVRGTGLYRLWERDAWRPYTHDQLIDVLKYDLMITPPYIRVSRMIRDIPSTDIEVGNKKINLRQNVQQVIKENHEHSDEMRERSIRLSEVSEDNLHLDVISYQTRTPQQTTSEERFIQWTTPDNKLVGFARLSVPMADSSLTTPMLASCKAQRNAAETDASQSDSSNEKPAHQTALLREVQVFDDEDPLFEDFPGEDQNQAPTLGKRLFIALVDRACSEAAGLGCAEVQVNCACGMRETFRRLGFEKKHGSMIKQLVQR